MSTYIKIQSGILYIWFILTISYDLKIYHHKGKV